MLRTDAFCSLQFKDDKAFHNNVRKVFSNNRSLIKHLNSFLRFSFESLIFQLDQHGIFIYLFHESVT